MFEYLAYYNIYHKVHYMYCIIRSECNIMNMLELCYFYLFFTNFQSDHCEMGKKSLVSSQSTGNVAYNWMAPDIIDDCPPCFASDMYSYCCVLWEMIKSKFLKKFLVSSTLNFYSKEYGFEFHLISLGPLLERVCFEFHLISFGLSLESIFRISFKYIITFGLFFFYLLQVHI